MTIKPDTLRAAHLDALLGDYCSQSSPTENLTDILADAMHWCLLNGESFATLLTTAQMHVETEAGVPSNEPRLHRSMDLTRKSGSRSVCDRSATSCRRCPTGRPSSPGITTSGSALTITSC